MVLLSMLIYPISRNLFSGNLPAAAAGPPEYWKETVSVFVHLTAGGTMVQSGHLDKGIISPWVQRVALGESDQRQQPSF
jgi:hypothetical protein